MRTKDECLDEQYAAHNVRKTSVQIRPDSPLAVLEFPSMENILHKAMDEYAKEISIGFAEFCGRYGDKGPDGTWSEHMWSGNIMNGEPDLTTEQLFDLYLQETSKP